MRLIFNESARIGRDVISVSNISSAGIDKETRRFREKLQVAYLHENVIQ